MIGSLIYYGLYPLSKLLNTLAELRWNRRPVLINGKRLWDCDGQSPRKRSKEPQSVLLDQECRTSCELSGTSKSTHRRKRNTNGLVDGESVLEIIKAKDDENSQQQDLDVAMFHTEFINKDPETLNDSKLVLKQGLAEEQDAAMECDDVSRLLPISQQLASGIQRVYSVTAGMVLMAAGENPVMSDLAADQEIHLHRDLRTDTHATLGKMELSNKTKGSQETTPFEAVTKYDTEAEVKLIGGFLNEEKLAVQIDGDLGQIKGSSARLHNLGTLLADDHAQINDQTWPQSTSTSWHFPVGLGLTEITDNSYNIQFPKMSYYPTVHENYFEVMWRVWEDLGENDHTSFADSGSKFTFTVMSYNILAQDLLEANSKLYSHCSEDVLAWEYRFQTILKELQTWEPDIICLQEVQANHYQEQMHPALTEIGYSCVYKRRTGTKTDGCAVCYKAQRFTQLSVSLLEFQHNDRKLLDRDNVGIVLLLQPTTDRTEGVTFGPICVANTHLLFNPSRGDIKLAQLAIVLAEIDKVVKQCRVKGHDCQSILCGDLNSIPHMPLYELIITGRLYFHGMPTWMVSGQEDLSYKTYHKRLYAPLWPSSLGINDNCQYFDASEFYVKESGKLQYNHDFLRQLRYCPAACVRPLNLQLIPGVTDLIPTPDQMQQFAPRRFRNTVCHGLNLSSVYSHNITGTAINAVTTLHSDGATMVDYIFFSRQVANGEKGLKLLGRLALQSEADLWSQNGLPSQTFPSDHLSLMAKFQLC